MGSIPTRVIHSIADSITYLFATFFSLQSSIPQWNTGSIPTPLRSKNLSYVQTNTSCFESNKRIPYLNKTELLQALFGYQFGPEFSFHLPEKTWINFILFAIELISHWVVYHKQMCVFKSRLYIPFMYPFSLCQLRVTSNYSRIAYVLGQQNLDAIWRIP